MAMSCRKNIDRVIAIVAGLVLAFGLVPVTASAAGEGADNAGGQVPGAPQAVAAAGLEAPPASPEKADGDAAEGGEAVEGGAQDGAGASGEDPGETGDAKADTPADGDGENAPGAAPADDGAAGGGKAEAPGEGAGESTSDTPTEGAGAGEAPAAEDGEATANAQAAQPAAQAEDAATGAKAQLPAFRQSKTVGGVTVTVEAGEGAFPEGARLSVASVPSSRTEAAVAPERDENENVAASYTFDIKVLGADGAELQPAGGGSVRVSFKAAEVADPNLDVSVYHVSGGEAEELAVSESGSTATARTDGFSYYTVEFTYGDLQYVLPGGGSVPLADVLAEVGLEGEPTDAASSDPGLFSVARDASGAWTVSARRAFSSAETLTVTINGAEYAIAVTDEIIDSGMCGDHLGWWLDDEGTLTIGGWGPMKIFTVEDRPWHSQSTSITSVVIENGATSITHDAFSGCTKLTNVIIPSSMQEIWSDAFQQCTSLTSVVIPDSVTSIGHYAFGECSNLASVTISSGETTIEYDAFHYCYNLKDVYYGGTEEEWNQVKYRFPEKVKVHYIVTATANDANGGTAEGGGNYTAGTEIALIATPKSGYVFDCWTENGRPVEGAGAKYTFTVIEGRTLVANFRQVSIGDIADQAYTGSAIEPKNLHVELIGVDGASSNEVLIEGEDYTLSYDNNVNAGEAAVIVTLDNRFSGEAKAAFNILQADLSTATVEVADQVYDGTALKPTPTVTWHEKQVGADDYTAAYADNVRAGEATVTVTGKRNFKDTTSTSGTFEIKKRPVTITADSAEKAYDGTPLTADGFSCEGLAEGDSVASAKVEGSQTDVGSSANTVSGAKVVNAKGEDVTACYEITYTPGTLTVEAAPAMKGTLTFDLAGGTLDGKTGTVTVEANVGDTIKLPGAPTKRGYAFKFWKGSEYAAGAEYKVEGDHAFTAEWAAVHTVAFDANGHGKAPGAQEVEHGGKAKRPANPTASGYTFGGWYKDKACKEAYDFSAPVTEDVTLYAKWTRKSSSGSGTSPKTGDPLAGAFAIALALAAASALALVLSRRRRRG